MSVQHLFRSPSFSLCSCRVVQLTSIKAKPPLRCISVSCYISPIGSANACLLRTPTTHLRCFALPLDSRGQRATWPLCPAQDAAADAQCIRRSAANSRVRRVAVAKALQAGAAAGAIMRSTSTAETLHVPKNRALPRSARRREEEQWSSI